MRPHLDGRWHKDVYVGDHAAGFAYARTIRDVTNRRPRGYTIIEIAITLFLISALTVAASVTFGGSRLQGSDAVAQTTADAAVDAAVAVFQLEGTLDQASSARLAIEQPNIVFVTQSAVSSNSSTASVFIRDGVVAAAVAGGDGSCWMIRRAIDAAASEPLRLYVLVPSGVLVTCSAQLAMTVSTLPVLPGRGDAWRSPLVWATPGEATSSVLSEAVLLLASRNAKPGSQSLQNDGTAGTGLNATFGTTQSVDTFDPVLLEYSGYPYLWTPSSVNNYATTISPDSAAAVTDIDIRMRLNPETWQAPAGQKRALVTQNAGNGKVTFSFALNGDRLEFARTVLATGTTVTFTSAFSVATWTLAHWIRMTFDSATGATTFYFSADSPTQPSTWSLMDTTINPSASGASALGAGYDLNVAASDVASGFRGAMYLVEVRDGINGPVVARFDASNCDPAGLLCSGGNGESWAIERASTGSQAAIVTRSVLIFGQSVLSVPYAPQLEVSQAQSITVVAVYRSFATTPLSALVAKESSTGWALTFGSSSSSVQASLTDGTLFVTPAASVANSGLISAAARFDAGTSKVKVFGSQSAVEALWPSPPWPGFGGGEPLLVGALGQNAVTASRFSQFEMVGVAVFNRALSDTEVARAEFELAAAS